MSISSGVQRPHMRTLFTATIDHRTREHDNTNNELHQPNVGVFCRGSQITTMRYDCPETAC